MFSLNLILTLHTLGFLAEPAAARGVLGGVTVTALELDSPWIKSASDSSSVSNTTCVEYFSALFRPMPAFLLAATFH